VRERFQAKAASGKGGSVGPEGPELDKNGFKSLLKELCKMSFEGAPPFERTDMMPKEKDFDVAFIVADEDKSGECDFLLIRCLHLVFFSRLYCDQPNLSATL
jgi:hypothetical protein